MSMVENTERKAAPPAITQVDGGSTATYGYDVDGRRVSRVVAGVETDYIYDLSGHAVATYGGGCGNTCWNTGFIYLNGQMVAEYFGGTYFVSADHLGSTRLLTGYPTASAVECDDYYPFGELTSCGGTSTTTHKFTGYERDSESNLDNAQARYNSSSLGRFMSPDPIGNFVADATNPQTWNMYSYVNNNPLAFVDPAGLQVEGGGPPLRSLPSWYDCQPQMFMRTTGNPFDAGTPYGPTDFFDTTSTFCGAGGDWGRHFVDGGGAGGRGGCPLNSAGVSSCIAAPPPPSCGPGTGHPSNGVLPNSMGVSPSVSTVNPLTSKGGGVWGANAQSFGATTNAYAYSGTGLGFDVGVSSQSVWAWGSGSWAGSFHSVNWSIGVFSGSIFWTPGKGGWTGFSFGLGLGLPGLAYEQTNYTCKSGPG